MKVSVRLPSLTIFDAANKTIHGQLRAQYEQPMLVSLTQRCWINILKTTQQDPFQDTKYCSNHTALWVTHFKTTSCRDGLPIIKPHPADE